MKHKGKKKKSSQDNYDLEMDLMPMIDVVFQLIIFFLLVLDFSSQQLEPVTLPDAETAEEEEDAEHTVMVNIAHDRDVPCDNYSMNPKEAAFHRVCDDIEHWNFVIRREEYKTASELRGPLREAADAHRDPETEISNTQLIIRADSRAPWVFVDDVMMEAAREGVRIKRVNMTANMPDPTQ